MLNPSDREQILKEHWNPDRTIESFRWAIQNYCEDYPSVRQGVQALAEAVEKRTDWSIPASTLHTYAYSTRYAAPMATTVSAVLGTILEEGK